MKLNKIVKTLRFALCRYVECHYAECRYTWGSLVQCYLVSVITLSVVRLSAVMQSVIILSVVMLSAVTLSVMMPYRYIMLSANMLILFYFQHQCCIKVITNTQDRYSSVFIAGKHFVLTPIF